jgi:serine/threonine protein kinase
MITKITNKYDLKKIEEIYKYNNNLIYECEIDGKSMVIKMLSSYDTDTKRFSNECLYYSDNSELYDKFKTDEIDGNKFIIMPKYNKIDSKSFNAKKIEMKKLIDLLNHIRIIHEKGNFQRDIKLPNIMIDENENLVLIDFGLVKFEKNIVKERYTKIEEKISNEYYSDVVIRNHGITISHPYLFDLIAISKLFFEFIGGSLNRQTRRFSIDEREIIDAIYATTNSNDVVNVNSLGKVLSDITKIKLENVTVNALGDIIELIDKIWYSSEVQKSRDWLYYNTVYIEKILSENSNVEVFCDDIRGFRYLGIVNQHIKFSRDNFEYEGKIKKVSIEEKNDVRLIRISFSKHNLEQKTSDFDVFGNEIINIKFDNQIVIIKQFTL